VSLSFIDSVDWIPACAGMTGRVSLVITSRGFYRQLGNIREWQVSGHWG